MNTHPHDWPLADAAALTQALAVMPGDVVLAVDGQGSVLAAAHGDAGTTWALGWVGQPWPDTADAPSHAKATALLGSLAQDGRTPRRELNHTDLEGAGHLVAWAGTRLGPEGPSLLMGRDLAVLQAQQQQLLSAQQQLESRYWEAALVRSRLMPR